MKNIGLGGLSSEKGEGTQMCVSLKTLHFGLCEMDVTLALEALVLGRFLFVWPYTATLLARIRGDGEETA